MYKELIKDLRESAPMNPSVVCRKYALQAADAIDTLNQEYHAAFAVIATAFSNNPKDAVLSAYMLTHAGIGEIEDEKANLQGRVIILPCAVGDWIFYIWDGEIYHLKVVRIKWSSDEDREASTLVCNDETGNVMFVPMDGFGVCAFFSHEEAEKALENTK